SGVRQPGPHPRERRTVRVGIASGVVGRRAVPGACDARCDSERHCVTPRRARIAVVGRGPVGLAAALSVADNGYDVILIGPPAPRDERTAALLAGSIALLTRLGVWPHLLGEAAPLKTLRIVDGTRRLFRAPEVAFESGEIGLAAFGYNLPNAILTAAL